MQTDHCSIGSSTVRRRTRPCSSRCLSVRVRPNTNAPAYDGVGQKVVHGAIARARPAHPPRADGPARQLLIVGDQLAHDLPRGAQPPPQREHAVDRVAHLLVGRQHDAAVLVAVQADWEVLLKLAALGLVAKPAVEARADQVQFGLAHRAFEPEQQPVVEIRR